MTTARRPRPMVLLVTVAFVLAALAVPASARPAVAATTRVGAASTDWPWLDSAIGQVQIYRDFDQGFSYTTWQRTAAYQRHPNAPANDYSFKILPQRLLDPADSINARLRDFIATTPKNIILTNHHEPDWDYKYLKTYTPAQYRRGMVALANMVRAQNALDGGTRRTSIILMDVSFSGYWVLPASEWWPTDARDGGHVDLIAGDIYALPHATGTACCPAGYTDGIKWQKPSYMLSFLRNFAAANQTPWAISEVGYLEDVNNPDRKAAALKDAVAYAKANGAQHISYFDAVGPRADWRLRWSSPVGTASKTSKALLAWKAAVATP